MEIITVNPQKCIGCNACIRVCPVREACVSKTTADGKMFTGIDPEKCINCGECIKQCPHGARDYLDDYEDFIEDMYTKKGRISLLVDPSVKVAFKNTWQDVLRWFYTQGIRKIYDVSFGADIATWAQLNTMNAKDAKKYITQPCAAVVNYIEKHDAKLIENLSPVHSPEACMAIYAKKYLNDTSEFAYLGPCIAKKSEFADIGFIKYNITFKRMKEYFEKRQIVFTNTGQGASFEFTGRQGFLGAIYPEPGGLKENILTYRNDFVVASCSGNDKVYDILADYASIPEKDSADILEVLSCSNGCHGGVGIGTYSSLSDIASVMKVTRADAKKRRSGSWLLSKGDKLFKEFDKTLSIEEFHRQYIPKSKFDIQPTNNDLNNIFNSMCKKTSEDRNINCRACGSKTCLDMAVSIFHNTNIKENCIFYTQNLPKNDSAQIAEIRKFITDMSKIIKDNMPVITENVGLIRKEAVSIFTNNSKTADAAKTINSVIEQMIEACNNPKGVSHDTLVEICSTLDLIRKILLNLEKSVSKNSESGYNIDKCITAVDNVSINITESIDNITKNKKIL